MMRISSDGDDDDVRKLHSTQEITPPARLAASMVCVREANFDHRLFLGPVLRSFPCELMLRRRIVMMIMAMSVLEMHKRNEDVQLFNSKLIGINKRGAVRFPPVTMEQSKALGSETSCKKNRI